MILVFILLAFVIFFNLALLIVVLSNIKLEIKKLNISNVKEKLKIKFKLSLSVYLLDKIKIFEIKLDNIRFSKLLKSGKINMQKMKLDKEANKLIIYVIKHSNITIEKIELNGFFSTEFPILTSTIYAITEAILPIVIAPKIKGKYINKIEFLNISKNVINLNAVCIINAKIVNIINTLYLLKKKGGSENNGKSSNRRPYAYCNE